MDSTVFGQTHVQSCQPKSHGAEICASLHGPEPCGVWYIFQQNCSIFFVDTYFNKIVFALNHFEPTHVATLVCQRRGKRCRVQAVTGVSPRCGGSTWGATVTGPWSSLGMENWEPVEHCHGMLPTFWIPSIVAEFPLQEKALRRFPAPWHLDWRMLQVKGLSRTLAGWWFGTFLIWLVVWNTFYFPIYWE